MKKWFFRIVKTVGIILLLAIISLIIFIQTCRLHPPEVHNDPLPERIEVAENHYTVGKNWLKLNRPGMWEMYLEGDAYERGISYGVLARDLVIRQEEYFVAQIKEMIPSQGFLNFLKYFIAIFNRNIDKNIPPEYLEEIYGVSRSASEEFTYIGTNYERLVNYHAAHDIGHALADLMLVGCTSFSVNDELTEDSSLLIGRNFDFFVGDNFAKEKIVCFVKPDEGIPFAMITWGGMIGAVSGTNIEGLTITINAAKSAMPRSAATPISILAREILQYASTIEEAYAIAEKRKTFVSESLLIGSSKDGRTAIIEKSPKKMMLYEEMDNDIVCTNHYQSELFSNDVHNTTFKDQTPTDYRFQRTASLMKQYGTIDHLDMAAILRDRGGVNGEELGFGNDHALNQLIAHHSIIFKPDENQFWVTSYPYALGAYIAYDLDDVFTNGAASANAIHNTELEIEEDSFLYSDDFHRYQDYLRYRSTLESASKGDFEAVSPYTDSIVAANPEYFLSHKIAADFYMKFKYYEEAKELYEDALTKNGISKQDQSAIEEQLKKTSN